MEEAADYTNIDAAIVDTIREIRAEHQACTMHAVAGKRGYSVSMVSKRCVVLREKGLITYTRMMGSLAVVDGVQAVGGVLWKEDKLVHVDQARVPWQQAIIDKVVDYATDVDRTVVAELDDTGFVDELVHLVPRAPRTTDEQALAIAAQHGLVDGPAPEQRPLSTLEEALRLEELGDTTDVTPVLDPDGPGYDARIAAAMAEAAALPHTPSTLAESKTAARAQKVAAKQLHPKRNAAKQPKVPKQRTPEEQAALNARMAKVRASRST